jgi:hypothetical protein
MQADAPDISPVAVAVAALGVLLGPEWAHAAGAYSVITLGWIGGVMVGVYRMPPARRAHIAAFTLVSFVAVIGVTVPLARWLAGALPNLLPWGGLSDPYGLLFPLAFALPAIGHSWLSVGRWAWGLIRRRAEPHREGAE